MLNFIQSRWSNPVPRGRRSADFLKVTSVLGRREHQVNHRILRPISERVLHVAWNFDEVSRTYLDPTHFGLRLLLRNSLKERRKLRRNHDCAWVLKFRLLCNCYRGLEG